MYLKAKVHNNYKFNKWTSAGTAQKRAQIVIAAPTAALSGGSA